MKTLKKINNGIEYVYYGLSENLNQKRRIVKNENKVLWQRLDDSDNNWKTMKADEFTSSNAIYKKDKTLHKVYENAKIKRLEEQENK